MAELYLRQTRRSGRDEANGNEMFLLGELMFGLNRPLFLRSELSRNADKFHDEWEAWAKSVRDKPYESEWAEAEVWAEQQREDARNRRAERLLGA